MSSRGGTAALLVGLLASCGARQVTPTQNQAPRPECAAQEAKLDRVFARACCKEPPRVAWDGRRCVLLPVPLCHCSSCLGKDCTRLFTSAAGCERAYAACRPR
jgi:hypothetical protein